MPSLKFYKEDEIREPGMYLWRYVSLHKLLDFMIEPSFYLNRLDNFNDLTEGKTYAELTADAILNDESIDDQSSNINVAQAEMFGNVKKMIRRSEPRIEDQYVNSLFLGSGEKMAMWQIYSTPGSVVIKIKPDSFINVIRDSIDRQEFSFNIDYYLIGKVEYLEKKVRYRSLRKGEAYDNENEIRLVAQLNPPKPEILGFKFKIFNIEDLEFDLITHPLTPDWEEKNLKLLLDKYLKKELRKSTLYNTLRN